MLRSLPWSSPFVRRLHWVVLLFAVVTFLLYGLSEQGFWEAPPVERNASVQAQVPRTVPGSEPTELSRFLALEKSESTSWPLMVQWLFRGSARLPGPVERNARLPAVLAMMFLWSFGVWGVWRFLRRRTVEAGTMAAGTVEAGTVEAGTVEAGTVAAGTVAAGTVAAGTVEAGTVAWWTGLALLSMPAFLLTARTLQPDALVVFFSSAAVLAAGLGVSGWLRRDSGWGAFAVLSVACLGAATLSADWFQGLAFPVLAAGMGTCFIGKRAGLSRPVLVGAGIACVLSAGALLLSLSTGWWLPDVNPASVVPAGSRPHAVFTVALVRTMFGTFPWSIPALIGVFVVPDDETPQVRFLRLFGSGWLLVSLLSGAYHEMRVGPAAMTGLFPMAMLGALAWMNLVRTWKAPALVLVTALFALLLFRDFALYPQLPGELVTTYEIPEAGVRVTGFRWPVLVMLVPLGTLVLLRLASFVPGWVDFWSSLRRQSLLFGLATWPLGWVVRFFGWLRQRLFSGWHPVARMRGWLSLVPDLRDSFMWASAAVFLAFSAWFALWALPALTREFSTRPVFAAAKSVDPAAALAVFEVSPLPAPVYAGRPAGVLAGDPDLTNFMKTDESRMVVFPRKLLGRLHHQSRIGSWKYHVLHTDSPSYMLGSTRLPPGQADINPLLAWVSEEPPKMPYSISSDLEGKLELVGYDVPRTAARGQEITVRLVFRVRYPLLADNKVFIHLDPPYGTRITADHDPVKGLLPTRYFPPGTHVIDEHTFRIPKVGFPPGRYGVFAGLFAGNNRVKVTGGAHAGQNRIPLGQMEITLAPSIFSCKSR